MTQSFPLVSIIMPVYNSETFLDFAIESMLTQTYPHFEFLIINDGSTDHSEKIIKLHMIKDKRIKLINHSINMGITSSLNEGLINSKGTYIARMDSDDISLPERLYTQVMFMEKKTEIGVCGTFIKFIDEKGVVGALQNYPISHEEIRSSLLFNCQLAHPTVMIRRQIACDVNLQYDNSFLHAEDYELWGRTSQQIRFANIPKPLLLYRKHFKQISHENFFIQQQTAHIIRRLQLHKIGIIFNKNDEIIFQKIADGNYDPSQQFLIRSKKILEQIYLTNLKNKFHHPYFLKKILSLVWYSLCRRSAKSGINDSFKYLLLPPCFIDNQIKFMINALKITFHFLSMKISNKKQR